MSVLLAPWVKYFEGINKLLGTQQAAATQHFGLFQSVASPDPGARAVLDRMQLTDLVVVLLRHDGRSGVPLRRAQHICSSRPNIRPADSPEGNKQFVISTCDEKLLQLARQKFRHLGDAAKP
jgi:exonuclease SbcC